MGTPAVLRMTSNHNKGQDQSRQQAPHPGKRGTTSGGTSTGSTGVTVNLDVVAALVREQGVWAFVDESGCGVVTLYAGAQYADPFDEDRTAYAAVAGPGTYGWGRGPNTATMAEFFITRDDTENPDGIDCSELDVRCEGDVAALIVAQTRRPLGAVLTQRQARRVLRRTHRRWPHRSPQ
ncbi:hypothetical protein [Kribbella sp. NPDC048928]|uniref:hypothetical protein n=1 Tax=Kribbella sp. NPDC048928 TaxID=3364111 RepID=UPI0037121302